MTTQLQTPIPFERSATVPTDGPRRRLFAGIWRLVDDAVDEAISSAKDEVLRDLPPELIEIGAGRGANLGRYRPGTEVTAFEPNTYMHAALIERARASGVRLTPVAADLRDAAVPTGTVDAVVSTLTLCSVPDRDELIGEIRRVLRPGGRFHFVEHVAEPTGSRRRRAQQILRRPWRAVFDRCDTCADTDRAIRDAGFADLEARFTHFGPTFDPTARTYWGVAIR